MDRKSEQRMNNLINYEQLKHQNAIYTQHICKEHTKNKTIQ